MTLPQLLVNGVEQNNITKFNINFAGANQLNTCDITIGSPDYDENTLFGKVVELYLNNGATDNIPIYRGIVKQVLTRETSISLKTVDVRGFLIGKEALSINLTENNNYDGFSIGQFLKKYITDKINTDKTLIGTDFLNDTTKLVSLTGKRGKYKPLDLVIEVLQEELDDTDIDNPLSYIFDIEEGHSYSNLIIKKQRLLKDQVAMNLSSNDGIISYSYKRRPVPSQVSVIDTSQTGGNVDNLYITKVGNSPQGPFAANLSKSFKDPAHAKKHAILHIKRMEQEVDEISVTSSKGYYLGLESLVYISVGKDAIDGVHRLVSKTITFNDVKGFTCKMNFNKRPIKVSDYLTPQ